MKTALIATAAAATLVGGAAQAHGYDRADLPPPPYAQDGHAYALGGHGHNKGFPLVGADAGVTVLGVRLGGSAKIRIGLDEELQERHHRRLVVQRYVAPPRADRDDDDGDGAPPCCQHGRW